MTAAPAPGGRPRAWAVARRPRPFSSIFRAFSSLLDVPPIDSPKNHPRASKTSQNPTQKPPPEPLFSVCNFHIQFSKQTSPISCSARAAQVHSVPLFTRWNWVRHIHAAQKILLSIASNFLPKSMQNCVQNDMQKPPFPAVLMEPHFLVFSIAHPVFELQDEPQKSFKFY